MSYRFEKKDFTTVGKGSKQIYKARQIDEKSWKHENEGELIADVLEITDGKFGVAESVILQGLNSWLRFKDSPTADPGKKALNIMKKAGLSIEDLEKLKAALEAEEAERQAASTK